MGMEIRRVPKDWVHPTYDFGVNEGEYIPMFGKIYIDELNKWLSNHFNWLAGNHKDQVLNPEATKNIKFFSEWDGDPPSIEDHLPVDYDVTKATHFQVYETVTEGTPVSEVMTLAKLR